MSIAMTCLTQLKIQNLKEITTPGGLRGKF